MPGVCSTNSEVRNEYSILVGRLERDHLVDYSPLEGYCNGVQLICEGVEWLQWAQDWVEHCEEPIGSIRL